VEPEVLAHRIAELAEEELAEDILILDMRTLSDVADYFVVMSGKADMHLYAIADGIESGLKSEGIAAHHREGKTGVSWVLIDYIDVVVHLFLPPVREFFALEELWGDAPMIRMEGAKTAMSGYEEGDWSKDDNEDL